MKKINIRKDDIVQVISGEDVGKKGRVLKIVDEKKKAIVEGINLVKKHKKATKQGEQSGIITMESPISVSNLMIVCPKCNQLTRISHSKTEKKSVRVCKKCGEMISR
ncbi:MAG: 50S ribosomal protein L24 [bacterium (Candidatus Stahlbacteria) CG23_combo_of_CG06-09_8_20_14_all_34_7]|nr:MAG: 50S ribosomal protein L24 [bacterium (Candidatus Stahlbacteria) CG23_combo_of_CG06-09_8_20_14_all_34_7]